MKIGAYLLLPLTILFWHFPVWSQSFCVIRPETELRSTPERKTEILKKVGVYTPLQGTGEKKNGFVEVLDVSKRKFWVWRKHVSGRTRCVTIIADWARVRKGPGKEHGSVTKAFEKYTSFKDVGGEDGWTQVQNQDGVKGWINLDQVWKPYNHKMRLSFEPER